MKKNMIIRALILVMTTGACVFVQAQQQKPSERSFAAEVNKVKEKQAARNTMIRQMQQPSGNTSVSTNTLNDQQVKSQGSKVVTGTAPGNSAGTAQQNTQSPAGPGVQGRRNKPSSGPMRQPRRPGVQ